MSAASPPISVTFEASYHLSLEQEAFVSAEIEAGRIIRVATSRGSTLYVRFGEGRAVPLTFAYQGTGPVNWQMIVENIPGEPARCAVLTLSAPPGGHILAETLRTISLKRFLEEALLMSAIEIDETGNQIGEQIRDRVSTVVEARKVHGQIAREHRRRLRGTRKAGRVTDDLLDEVARVYRENISNHPVAAVKVRFDPISRTTAGRWVQMARAAGKLGQAPGKGVAGETREEQ